MDKPWLGVGVAGSAAAIAGMALAAPTRADVVNETSPVVCVPYTVTSVSGPDSNGMSTITYSDSHGNPVWSVGPTDGSPGRYAAPSPPCNAIGYSG